MSDASSSLSPREGWHCLHLFYRFDRAMLDQITGERLAAGRRRFVETLDPRRTDAPRRLQTWIVSGHKADFAVMALDPDPLKLDGLHHELLAGPLGPGLTPAYSFVSLTEVSEYLLTSEQYAERLKQGGQQPGDPTFEAKVKTYAEREERMRRARLTPDLPDFPAACFYPMNKKRAVGENWFTLSFDERSRMMAEHARSGMKFAGDVTQLVTVGIGLEDWEWSVTLWARRPDLLKDIVYRMRYDEASARYGEFGPFYAGYVCGADRILDHCRVGGLSDQAPGSPNSAT